MFWSGQSFETPGLKAEGSFMTAVLRLTDVDQIDPKLMAAWLDESRRVQWDYKNIYRTKGKLARII